MQVLKDDLRVNILENALKEFFNKGFNEANMRSIARKSKMTVGNIYRYFKNKDELFRIVVEPVYNRLTGLINVEEDLQINYRDHFENIEPILSELIDICNTYPKQMVILLVRYIGVEDYYLINNLENMIIKRLNQELKSISFEQSQMICHLIFRGILFILQSYKDSNIEKELRSFFVFLFKDIDQRL